MLGSSPCQDRKSTRLNSSHSQISYAVFCLKKKNAEDRFHCPCHGSQYEKRTAVVLRIPAPKPLQLFHIAENAEGQILVDTNPLRLIDRTADWDPQVIEITDT